MMMAFFLMSCPSTFSPPARKKKKNDDLFLCRVSLFLFGAIIQNKREDYLVIQSPFYFYFFEIQILVENNFFFFAKFHDALKTQEKITYIDLYRIEIKLLSDLSAGRCERKTERLEMALVDCPTGETCFFFFQYADADYIPMSPFIFWTFTFFTTEILCVIKRHRTDNFLRSPSSRDVFIFFFISPTSSLGTIFFQICHFPPSIFFLRKRRNNYERKKAPAG